MRSIWAFVWAVAISVGLTTAASANTVQFDFKGKAGTGLLPGNQNTTISGTPGSGGEIGAGITFDDVTRILTLNVGWGAGNGFNTLTGPTTGGHIHGPTASSGTAAFTEDTGVLFPLDGLPGWNTSASSGGFVGTVSLTTGQATELLAGRYYFNVHTSANGNGEIRGNLVAVPEPASLGAIALAGVAALTRRRRR